MAMEDIYLVVIEIDEGTTFFNLANGILTEIIPRCGLRFWPRQRCELDTQFTSSQF